jgi:uncharacterized protein
MRILRQGDYRTVPWKNGGGETTEILILPPGAGQSTFDVRISMAQVAGDGPFSVFPGVDRTLAVLSGEAIALTLGDDPPVVLDRQSPPFTFAGDVPTFGRPQGGPITDLNVMVRRGRYVAKVRRLAFGEEQVVEVSAEHAVVFCAEGGVRFQTSLNSEDLAALETYCGRHCCGTWKVKPVGQGVAYLIEINGIDHL